MKPRFSLVSLLLLLTAGALFAQAQPEAQEHWVLDPAHSSVTFSVRHLLSKVPGEFTTSSADFYLDRSNLENSKVDFSIDPASINTRVANRDKHLRSADFFDVEKFPEIRFRSTAIRKTGDNTFDVEGILTMHGVSKKLTIPATLVGFIKDPGATRRLDSSRRSPSIARTTASSGTRFSTTVEPTSVTT